MMSDAAQRAARTKRFSSKKLEVPLEKKTFAHAEGGKWVSNRDEALTAFLTRKLGRGDALTAEQVSAARTVGIDCERWLTSKENTDAAARAAGNNQKQFSNQKKRQPLQSGLANFARPAPARQTEQPKQARNQQARRRQSRGHARPSQTVDNAPMVPILQTSFGTTESQTTKQLRKLQKLLRQIDDLAAKQASGATLELNQATKLQRRQDTVDAIAAMELAGLDGSGAAMQLAGLACS
jgi:hypothetical protein